MSVGISRSTIDRRLRAAIWERVDTGVYRLVATPASWKQRLLAACLVGPAVASHRSAGALWGLAGVERDVVEVTALRHRRRHSRDVVWHESYLMRDRDLTEVEGVPITTPTRTAIDLAVVLRRDELAIVVDDVIRRGLSSLARLRRMVERMGPRRPGAARIRRELELRSFDDVLPQSALETRFVELIRRCGLPEPHRQYRIDAGGRRAYVDFAYPDRQVAIELDGYEGHGGRAAWQDDLHRQNAVASSGWRVVRFSWSDVERRPEQVVAVVADVLRAHEMRT